MAETKSSTRGKQHKKIVPVKAYKTETGKSVHGYRRSTPRPRTKI